MMSKIILSTEDIIQIYGSRFWLIPDKNALTVEEKIEAPIEPVTSGPEVKNEILFQKESIPTIDKEPAIQWRPKDTSKVLFVLHSDELKNKELTDLLKKIVLATKIPFEKAGFGIVHSVPSETDWQAMPTKFGVVFDQSLQFPEKSNPASSFGKEFFFASKLDELSNNEEAKAALWKYLKSRMADFV